MKLNKKISKFLVLGLLTNNIYFNSSANTDIPNRYETLEGEYITIDDSTEGNLEEIEIFGNTVQNENNLEDIQSVGDLYVDEDGNPILDRQGRKQYKIEIVSRSKTYIENKFIYLLPYQLESIKPRNFRSGYKDRLYYDNSKRKYILEKGINEIVKNTSEINDSDFLNSSLSNEKYFVLELPARILANDIKRYSIIMMNGFDFDESGEYKVFLNDAHMLQFFIPIEDLVDNTLDSAILKWREVMGRNIKLKYVTNSPQTIELHSIPEIKICTYDEKTHIYVNSENGINPTLKVTVDRLPQIAKEAVVQAENNRTNHNISLARMYVNMLPESLYKDQLQEQLSQVFSSDITLDRESASSNLDVYVKSENMLSISLDTNSITFDGYSGVDTMELTNAVNLTVNSSLPYDLNAYMPIEITNSDKSETIPIDILNIKESSETDYKQFANTTDKVVLKDNCIKGNGINHSIDLKLDSNAAHKADVYKTVIKFEAEQK